MTPRKLVPALALALALASAAARAQEGPAPELTAPDVAAFVDGYLPTEMDRVAGINGVSIAIVKDGQVLPARGYGSGDREHHVAMTPDMLVRIGSISKLFTWTAVKQLIERHQLDLDVDVQQYIDFDLPRTFAQPITLRDLLTHTGRDESLNARARGMPARRSFVRAASGRPVSLVTLADRATLSSQR